MKYVIFITFINNKTMTKGVNNAHYAQALAQMYNKYNNVINVQIKCQK